jgi:hypothetical protein
MRAALDYLFREGQLLVWGIQATGVLVETLLDQCLHFGRPKPVEGDRTKWRGLAPNVWSQIGPSSTRRTRGNASGPELIGWVPIEPDWIAPWTTRPPRRIVIDPLPRRAMLCCGTSPRPVLH